MIADIVARYLALFPEDKARLPLLLKQLEAGEDITSRVNYTGHVTGSAIIFSPDFTKMLLIYHPTFDRWQQPGGHWDAGEAGPWLTAEREAIEETGVHIKRALTLKDERVPIQIDSHLVPTKPPKNEPEHYHHDFRYVFVAENEELTLSDIVIKQAEWLKLADIEDSRLTKAAARAQKLLNLKA